MMLKVRVKLDKRALEAWARDLPANAEAALDTLADEGARYARSSMKPGPGPSKPGDFPNVQSGRLRASITVYTPAALRRRIASDVEYASALEFGTRTMAARPFFAPTLVVVGKLAGDVFKRRLT